MSRIHTQFIPRFSFPCSCLFLPTGAWSLPVKSSCPHGDFTVNNSYQRDNIVPQMLPHFSCAAGYPIVGFREISVAAIRDEKLSAEKETRVDAFTHARTPKRIISLSRES